MYPQHHFDKITPRQGTNSLKYDFHHRYNKPISATPLWVADMDFPVATEITAAIQKAVDHGIYGYSDTASSYFEAVASWLNTHHNYQVKEDWLIKTPGVVYALAMAIQAYCAPGEAVLIQKPLYYPIEGAILANGRQVLDNTLQYKDGQYTIDFVDFEEKARQAKIFILCNPHNPVGRVWTVAELTEMGRICKRHNVIVVSDEIHQDLVFAPHKHHCFSNLVADVPSIICTSPSKTFNLAGLQVSNIFIPDLHLRSKFVQQMANTGYSQLNTLGLVACQAACNHGLPWLNALKEYLWQNAQYVKNRLAQDLPQAHVTPLEGSYLMWIDFSPLGIPHHIIEETLLSKQKIWLSSGLQFGPTGDGFFRINLACPRSLLDIDWKL